MPMIDDLSERFQENVECSTHVDIAVAWATKTSALDQLMNAVEENGVSLRIIVGTHSNVTDPEVLDRLNGIGERAELRLNPHGGPLFHPKVYIFRGKKDSTAWIGSANFTNGGFGENVEAVFETKELRTVRNWFKSQWKQCGKLPENANNKSRSEAIDRYRERRRLKPPSQVLVEMIGRPTRDRGSRLEFLDQVKDWSGYVKALKKCQRWWKDSQGDFTVYGATHSWRHTIEQVGHIAKMDNWDLLSEDEIKKLVGKNTDHDLIAGFLGNMRIPKVTGFVQRFREKKDFRRRLKKAVDLVVNAHSNDFPNVAVKAASKLVEKENKDIGVVVATRLLALARPDRVISLNSKSSQGLAQIFPGIDELNPKNAHRNYRAVLDQYGRFLGRLYEEPWFDSPEPNDECERRLWSMRAALLDCFVYSA